MRSNPCIIGGKIPFDPNLIIKKTGLSTWSIAYKNHERIWGVLGLWEHESSRNSTNIRNPLIFSAFPFCFIFCFITEIFSTCNMNISALYFRNICKLPLLFSSWQHLWKCVSCSKGHKLCKTSPYRKESGTCEHAHLAVPVMVCNRPMLLFFPASPGAR